MVCKSVEEAFQLCYEDLINRIKTKQAIYGTACYTQDIITEKAVGIRPKLSGGIILESSPIEINSFKYGLGRYGHTYFVNKELTLEMFNTATKDDLYLFIIIAHPNHLKDEQLKNILLNRLSKIYQEELSVAGENADQLQKQHKLDREKFEFILDAISTAIKGPGNEIYYSKDYQPDDFIDL